MLNVTISTHDFWPMRPIYFSAIIVAMGVRTEIYQSLSAVITCLVVAVVSGLILADKPMLIEAMIGQALIVGCFALVTFPDSESKWPRPVQVVYFLVIPLIYFVGYRTHIEFLFIYTLIWIACAPIFLSRRQCWWALILLNVGWYLLRSLVWNDDYPLAETLLVMTFHAFALLSSLARQDSAEANERTQRLNRELLATQHLLSEASKDRERTRIARDLHDLLGHHLTALTINLQVAERLTQGEARDKIEQCHALAKLLLSDVRDAVGTLRSIPMVNLRELLEIAIRDTPNLQIDLEVPEEIQVDDVNTAEAILRCVQEAVTNTLKHSGAQHATIRLEKVADDLVLNYQDDGAGCEVLTPGHGLVGMRERLENLGGEVSFNSQPSMSIRATAPLIR